MIQAQNLRQIKLRIKSIGNTRKITKAMEMVSASKLSRVKASFFPAKAYITVLEDMLHSIISDSPASKNVLTEKRESIKNLLICVVTSDTGLCGAYNDNIIKHAERFLSGLNGPKIGIVTIGKEGYSYFRRKGYRVAHSYHDLHGRYSQKVSDEITNDLINMFTNRDADEVYVAYSRFSATLRHIPTVEKLLNIEFVANKPENHYIFEPSAQSMLDSVSSKYIMCKIRSMLLEAFTSEHSARMLAMKTATDNADDLTASLTLARNKARQLAITKEVLEIAASAEALKG